jgi:hypothetical protein
LPDLDGFGLQEEHGFIQKSRQTRSLKGAWSSKGRVFKKEPCVFRCFVHGSTRKYCSVCLSIQCNVFQCYAVFDNVFNASALLKALQQPNKLNSLTESNKFSNRDHPHLITIDIQANFHSNQLEHFNPFSVNVLDEPHK